MKTIQFLEFRTLLEKKGLNSTLLHLDNLLITKKISIQQHKVIQNWVASICPKHK